jgi:hypothetical protein
MGMTHRPDGIPAAQLTDDDLIREVDHLHATRHETFLHGGQDAFETHTSRMLELEHEYLRRFPEALIPSPLRTRAGRRQAAGLVP